LLSHTVERVDLGWSDWDAPRASSGADGEFGP